MRLSLIHLALGAAATSVKRQDPTPADQASAIIQGVLRNAIQGVNNLNTAVLAFDGTLAPLYDSSVDLINTIKAGGPVIGAIDNNGGNGVISENDFEAVQALVDLFGEAGRPQGLYLAAKTAVDSAISKIPDFQEQDGLVGIVLSQLNSINDATRSLIASTRPIFTEGVRPVFDVLVQGLFDQLQRGIDAFEAIPPVSTSVTVPTTLPTGTESSSAPATGTASLTESSSGGAAPTSGVSSASSSQGTGGASSSRSVGGVSSSQAVASTSRGPGPASTGRASSSGGPVPSGASSSRGPGPAPTGGIPSSGIHTGPGGATPIRTSVTTTRTGVAMFTGAAAVNMINLEAMALALGVVAAL